MNRRTAILAALALAISRLAKAETPMTYDERQLLITCAAAILSLWEVRGEQHLLSEADFKEICRMAEVQEHAKIAPLLLARLRRVV